MIKFKDKSMVAQALDHQVQQFALIVGSLSKKDLSAKVPYWPVEVSQFQLSIFSDLSLNTGEVVTFTCDDQEADLLVSGFEYNYRGTQYHLYHLNACDIRTNLEHFLRDVAELRRWNAHRVAHEPIRLPIGRIHVRAARFSTMKPIEVQAATFGTKARYVFRTENVSKSGLLLGDQGEKKAPFSDSTIVELVIDPECKSFAEPVHCLAKIVRLEEIGAGEESRHRFALQLIEIEDVSSTIWFDYIEELERELFHNTIAQSPKSA